MTVKDAINAVKVMLGADIPTEKVEMGEHTEEGKEVKMASAELVDGTIVYTEGEIEVGATLYVETEQDEDPFAPEGMHSTKDGLIVTVGEAGEIVSIEEEAGEEAVEETEVVEEVMSEDKEEEMEEEAKEEAFDAEGLLAAIADMIKDYKEYVDSVKEEMSEMKGEFETISERFNKIADTSGAEPVVKQSFMAEAQAQQAAAEARMQKLAKIRKQFS